MPSVERRIGKRDYWRIRYGVYTWENGGEQRRQKSKFLGYCPTTNDLAMRKARGELTKREAERIAARFMEGINGSSGIVIGSQVKLRDFIPRWLTEHAAQLAAPTRRQYQWAVDKHILPDLGDQQLGDLTTEYLQAWLNRKQRSWNTKAALRAALRVIFERAMDWGLWDGRNPVERVRTGKKRDVYARRLLSDEQAQRLIAEMPEDAQVTMELLRATGCRISEAMGLEWPQLDLSREIGWVSVEQRNWHGDIDVVKSEAGRREIPLGPLLTLRLKARAKPSGPVCRMTEKEMREKHLVPAAKRLGLYFKGFGFHSFRREVGTVLQELGASSIEAAIWLGHTRPAMTRRYTLMQRQRMMDLARKLEGGEKAASLKQAV
jgi:integrase